MTDLVIIPTFDRPEFLWLCLENLYENVLRAPNYPDIWVCEDIHADKPKGFTVEMDMLAVHHYWRSRLGYQYMATSPHTTYGNSYNVLNALQKAAPLGYRYVYLIEDDVLVTPGFFDWNEAVHKQFNPWASCAGRLNRSLNFEMNGREAIDENIKDANACRSSVTSYNSWATCFSAVAVKQISAMIGGYDNFYAGFEQDIMIQKQIRREKLTTVWGYVPRAFHMGWFSYHRDGGMKLYGTLEERVTALRAAVKDPAKLRALGAQDMDAFPTKHAEAFTELYLR